MEHGWGTVELKDDVLDVHLTAYGKDQPVLIHARIANPVSGPTGWATIEAEQLPLDDDLFNALPPKSAPFIRSLHAQGNIGFFYKIQRNDARADWHRTLNVAVSDCSIRYEKFPYPLQDIRGTLEMVNNHWTFRDDLVGRNDTGEVKCHGHLTPPGPGQEIYLKFVGTTVRLDEDLRRALRENQQEVWAAFRPQGTIDLEADVLYRFAEEKLDVGVTARPLADRCSIQPAQFPYRMEKLRGTFDYRDGLVKIEKFEAEHGPVKIASAQGYCKFEPNGHWKLLLDQLTVDRLRLNDRDLLTSLPRPMKEALLGLNPRGPVDLGGWFELEGGGPTAGRVRSRWNVDVNFHQASIDCGILLTNL